MTAEKSKRKIVPLDDLTAGPLVESVSKGTPLACALIAGAYIENALGSLLTKVLITGDTSNNLLNEPYGILNSASGRSDMCYCLGLIEKSVYANTRNIGRIRNRFAHSHLSIDFNDEKVKIHCDALKPPPMVDQKDLPLGENIEQWTSSSLREKFVVTALGTFVSLGISAMYCDGIAPVRHQVQCSLKTDGSLFVTTIVFLDE